MHLSNQAKQQWSDTYWHVGKNKVNIRNKKMYIMNKDGIKKELNKKKLRILNVNTSIQSDLHCIQNRVIIVN